MTEVSTLVTDRSLPRVFTANQECDARTALTRGLAEYLFTSVEAHIVGGRRVKFQNYFFTWADAEDKQVWPSLVAYAPDSPSQYQASRLSPYPAAKDRVSATDDVYVVSPSEFKADIVVDLWCSDTEERNAFSAAVEDRLNPATNQNGFVLDLPHYFGQRASYELMSSIYRDNDANVIKRFRVVSFFVSGNVPLTVLRSFKDPRIIVKTTVT